MSAHGRSHCIDISAAFTHTCLLRIATEHLRAAGTQDAKERYVELKPAAAKTGSSLEAELERTQRQLDIENFENKPVPKL